MEIAFRGVSLMRDKSYKLTLGFDDRLLVKLFAYEEIVHEEEK
jgi:hypothetical protein